MHLCVVVVACVPPDLILHVLFRNTVPARKTESCVFAYDALHICKRGRRNALPIIRPLVKSTSATSTTKQPHRQKCYHTRDRITKRSFITRPPPISHSTSMYSEALANTSQVSGQRVLKIRSLVHRTSSNVRHPSLSVCQKISRLRGWTRMGCSPIVFQNRLKTDLLFVQTSVTVTKLRIAQWNL